MICVCVFFIKHYCNKRSCFTFCRHFRKKTLLHYHREKNSQTKGESFSSCWSNIWQQQTQCKHLDAERVFLGMSSKVSTFSQSNALTSVISFSCLLSLLNTKSQRIVSCASKPTSKKSCSKTALRGVVIFTSVSYCREQVYFVKRATLWLPLKRKLTPG